MNKQKLISVLQSRIAKRRMLLASYWELFEELVEEGCNDSKPFKVHLLRMGIEQKEDKAILKQLYVDNNRQESYENTFQAMDREINKLRRQLASYKLTGMPYVSGNAN